MAVPFPADLFDYDVYIGCANADRQAVELLMSKWQSCECVQKFVLRSDSNDTASAENDIRNGIAFSRKCLLYLTRAYAAENNIWRRVEITAAAEKSNFGEDFVVVAMSSDVSVDVLQSEEFRQLTRFTKIALPIDDFTVITTPPTLADYPALPDRISGAADAVVYFYDYLKFLLRNCGATIARAVHEAVAVPPNSDTAAGSRSMPKIVQPCLVVLPGSGCAPVSMEAPGKIVHYAKQMVVHSIVSRCGDKNRNCRLPLLQLIVGDPQQQAPDQPSGYFFNGEFPASLVTLYEMFHSQMTGMSEQQYRAQRDDFRRTLVGLLERHGDQFDGQYRIVDWNDDVEPLYDCLLRTAKAECDNDEALLPLTTLKTVVPPSSSHAPLLLVDDATVTVRHGCTSSTSMSSLMKDTYETSRLPPGSSVDIRRGRCLIISIADGGDASAGGESVNCDSVCKLCQLFENSFDFTVKAHSRGGTEEELRQWFMHLADSASEQDDGCVVVLMSKASRPGTIRTSDGVEIGATTLLDCFDAGEHISMRGKPKVVFVLTTVVDAAPLTLPRTSDLETVASSGSRSADSARAVHFSVEAVDNDDACETDAQQWTPGTKDHISIVEPMAPSRPDYHIVYMATAAAPDNDESTATGQLVDVLVDQLDRGVSLDDLERNIDAHFRGRPQSAVDGDTIANTAAGTAGSLRRRASARLVSSSVDKTVTFRRRESPRTVVTQCSEP